MKLVIQVVHQRHIFAHRCVHPRSRCSILLHIIRVPRDELQIHESASSFQLLGAIQDAATGLRVGRGACSWYDDGLIIPLLQDLACLMANDAAQVPNTSCPMQWVRPLLPQISMLQVCAWPGSDDVALQIYFRSISFCAADACHSMHLPAGDLEESDDDWSSNFKVSCDSLSSFVAAWSCMRLLRRQVPPLDYVALCRRQIEKEKPQGASLEYYESIFPELRGKMIVGFDMFLPSRCIIITDLRMHI